MNEIPSFWEDETLTDNLKDIQAVKILNWLERVYFHFPDHYPYALSAVKSLNYLAGTSDPEKRLAFLNAIQDVLGISLTVNLRSTQVVNRIITQLKEQYEKK